MMKPMKKAMLELMEPTEEEAERDPTAMAHFKKVSEQSRPPPLISLSLLFQVLVEIGDHITATLTMEDTALWKT